MSGRRHGDRVRAGGVLARVVDVHADRVHASVLPDGGAALVRFRLEDLEDLP